MELGRIDAAADPKRLHGAGGRGGQCHYVSREFADCLFVPGVGTEGRTCHLEERIPTTFLGQADLDPTDRLTVRSVDDRTLLAAEWPDPVARPKKRMAPPPPATKQRRDLISPPPLSRRLRFLG